MRIIKNGQKQNPALDWAGCDKRGSSVVKGGRRAVEELMHRLARADLGVRVFGDHWSSRFFRNYSAGRYRRHCIFVHCVGASVVGSWPVDDCLLGDSVTCFSRARAHSCLVVISKQNGRNYPKSYHR